MFRVSTTPIIRSTPPSTVAKLAWPHWREVTAQKIWPVPETVVTVLCTHDDGCGWHPKHVEWTCRIINRLLFVASRWTIINIEWRYFLISDIYVETSLCIHDAKHTHTHTHTHIYICIYIYILYIKLCNLKIVLERQKCALI